MRSASAANSIPGTCCPDCGGDLRLVGEDVSEILDSEPLSAIGPRTMASAAQMKVGQIARLKKSCRRCEKMVQGEPLCAIGASTMASAPSRPIDGSMAGAGLLAHVLVSKFDDHLPLYRQNEIFARLGADIPDSTLVDWCGRACQVLIPLVERITTRIMASDLLHADDTPIRVLDRSLRDKGLGKGVRKGRIWAYVRERAIVRHWSEERRIVRHWFKNNGARRAPLGGCGATGGGLLLRPGLEGRPHPRASQADPRHPSGGWL